MQEYSCTRGRRCIGAPLCPAARAGDKMREDAKTSPSLSPSAEELAMKVQETCAEQSELCARDAGMLN